MKKIDYAQLIPALTHEEIFDRLGRGARKAIMSDENQRRHLPAFKKLQKSDGPYDHSRPVDDAMYELAYGVVEARRCTWQRVILAFTIASTFGLGLLMLREELPLASIGLLCGPLILGSQLISLLRLHRSEGKRERALRDKLTGCTPNRVDLLGPGYHQQSFHLFVRFAAFSDLLTDSKAQLTLDLPALRQQMQLYVAHAHELNTRRGMTAGERAGMEMKLGQIVEQVEQTWQELVAEHQLRAQVDQLPVYAPQFG